MFNYRGYTIEIEGMLGGFTVWVNGDDVFFYTMNEAKDFIDSMLSKRRI